MKNIKKILAVLLAVVMVLALSVTAFADDTGKDTSKKDGSTVSSAGVVDNTTGDANSLLTTPAAGNTVSFVKEIVIFNGSSSDTVVYLPNITYQYTIAPSGVTQGALIKDEYGTTGTVYDGVLSTAKGAVISTTTDSIQFSNTSGITGDTSNAQTYVTTTTNGAVASGKASFTFNPANYLHAGIYRYKITESLPAGSDRTAAGIYNKDYHADRYLDVYVQNDGASFSIYGYVLFDAANANQAFDAANQDLSKDEASNTYAWKTNGYTSNKTDLESVSTYDPNEKNVDMYYTYNLNVTKTITGALADKTNEFPFAVRLTNATITSGAKFSYVEDSTAGTSTANVVTMTNAGVGEIGTFNGNVAASTSTLKLKDGDNVYIYGVPSYGKVDNTIGISDVQATALVSEYNNTFDTYRVNIAYTNKTNTGTVDTTWNGLTDTTKTIAANGTAATTLATFEVDHEDPALIAFTNLMDAVSPTGIALRFAPYALILAMGTMLLLFSRKARKTED